MCVMAQDKKCIKHCHKRLELLNTKNSVQYRSADECSVNLIVFAVLT